MFTWGLFSLAAVVWIGLYAVSFRILPRARWQFLAAVPVERLDHGRWRGVNLTYYGAISATASVLGVAVFLALLGMLGISSQGAFSLAAVLVVVGLTAASAVNRLTAQTWFGFTVGGAAMCGLVAAPPALHAVRRLTGWIAPEVTTLEIAAVLGVAYALAESVGRLACVSFGCCYGKPVSAAPKWLQPIFTRFYFAFEGHTKKAVYADHLEYEPLIPVQGLSALVLAGVAMCAAALFFTGQIRLSFLTALLGSQGWRILSEYLRADERNGNRWRSYQVMALLTIGYGLGIVLLSHGVFPRPLDVSAAWKVLWRPDTLLGLQTIWLAVFVRMGVSQVTASDMAFFVRPERV